MFAGPASAQSNYADDRAEIQNLQARYMFGLDFRDGEEYASTFTEDGVLDYGAGKIRGREAIAAFVNNTAAGDEQQRAENASGLRPAASRHNISNIVLEIDGDHATATAYWFNMGNNNPERSAQLSSFGHYEDELERVDGKWLFSLRKIYNEQVAEWAASPGNPVINPSDGPGLRQ